MNNLKKEIINEISERGLCTWGDNGERRKYSDLSKEDVNEIADDIIQRMEYFGIGDLFKVISDRSRTTKDKPYRIFKKIEDESKIEYWFYNDRDQPSCIYPDEITRVKE